MPSDSESNSLLKQPSAWIPFVMSLVALLLLLGYVALFGTANGTGDEGVPARIFQLIMAAQLPIVGYFAVKWLPRRPKQSSIVLVLQAIAWIIPILAVLWLESL